MAFVAVYELAKAYGVLIHFACTNDFAKKKAALDEENKLSKQLNLVVVNSGAPDRPAPAVVEHLAVVVVVVLRRETSLLHRGLLAQVVKMMRYEVRLPCLKCNV